MEETALAAAITTLVVDILTRIGLPAIFVMAWFWERRAHSQTVQEYLRDLRRVSKLTRPIERDDQSASEAKPVKTAP